MVWKLSDLCLQCVQQNLDQYPDVGSKLPTQYKEILITRLACHDRFFPEQLTHISSNLFTSRLRHVNLQRCDQITDQVLELLGCSGCKLESLVLKCLQYVTDVGVEAVTRGQDVLCLLHLKCLPKITQKILSSIASPLLTSFKLQHDHNYSKSWCTQAALSAFLSSNPSIKFLKIDTDVENIPVIAKGLNKFLEEFRTCYQTVTDDKIEVLAQWCPNLKSLDLDGAKYVGKEALIRLFQACTQMSNLGLGYCNGISASHENEVLWTLPQSLTSLSLCGMMLQDKEILVECITRLPHIRNLKLCGVPALVDDSLHQIVEKIGQQLTELNLSGVGVEDVSDKGLESVAKYCTNLQALHISLLRRVTGLSLRPIFSDSVRAAKIKKLSINSKMMDVDVLDQVACSCPNLDVLDMSGLTCVTDNMIMSLADHSPLLTQIYLKGCKQITDVAICYISGFCPLTCLVLSGLHSLTDKSIFCLASSCPQMQEVYLNGCANISPVAVQYLKDCCLGRLQVKHYTPNASPNQLMAKNLDTGEFCRADLL